MTPTQSAARIGLFFVVLLSIDRAGFAQEKPPATPSAALPASDVQYISLTPAEFAEKAADLLNKDVEVAGDIQLPPMMSRKSVGTMVDKTSGKVLVQLVAKPNSAALQWLVGGDRATKTQGIYARGKIITDRNHTDPVLDLTDISRESKVQAAAANTARVEAITTKDKEGLTKDVLPPHTNPTGAAAKAWLDRVPTTSPSYDRAKSVWDNMQVHANWRGQTESDDRRAIIRGPERPANFETYYRGLRDTGLSNLFAQSPYRNRSTSWPRVMIVIEEKPKFNGGMPSEYWHNQGSKTDTDYTWRFHATVWTDATHSIDIAPFNWAFSEMRFNTPYSEVPIWGHTPKMNVPPPEGSAAAPGTQPAAGPIAPRYPLPETSDYRRLFHYNTIMVGNLLLDMGFNYNRPDGRVWIVEDLAP